MVSFARARTRSWLSRLLPVKVHSINKDSVQFDKSKEHIDNISEQNKCFIEAIKNGGLWFS